MIQREKLSWALYDWGNSAYATVVMAGFFPLFFKTYWAGDASATESTFYLGLSNSAASLAIMVAAPLLGAIADSGSLKKKLLGLFAFIGAALTACLALLESGQWQLALALYLAATLGFMGSNIFYDALLIDVAEESKRDWVSALGYGLGYLGGGALFALNVAMTQWPEAFGLADRAAAVRASFVCVAIWWSVFTLPLLLFVTERRAPRSQPGSGKALRAAWQDLIATLRHLRQLPMTYMFLIAYWFYIDGVDTVIRMAVDYGLAIGLNANDLILALLITQFIGFPAALAYGKLGERFGAKRGIMVGIFAYVIALIFAYRMETAVEFYALAVFIGLFQGGIQALSRSLFSTIIPPAKAGQFFGFYNMFGKFAVVMGPLLMGLTGLVLQDSRAAILSILVLFVVGALLLQRVDLRAARIAATKDTE